MRQSPSATLCPFLRPGCMRWMPVMFCGWLVFSSCQASSSEDLSRPQPDVPVEKTQRTLNQKPSGSLTGTKAVSRTLPTSSASGIVDQRAQKAGNEAGNKTKLQSYDLTRSRLPPMK